MDSRTAAHVLAQIAGYLELRGENPFRIVAHEKARPDAHSERGLDYMPFGVGMARKGWCTAGDLLSARSAGAVCSFARGRR